MVRGCGALDVVTCSKLTVDHDSTTNDSISLSWTVAERGEGIEFGTDYQIMTVTNEEHPSQLGVVTANQISRILDSDFRQFVSDNGLSVPGVRYTFEIKLVWSKSILYIKCMTVYKAPCLTKGENACLRGL